MGISVNNMMRGLGNMFSRWSGTRQEIPSAQRSNSIRVTEGAPLSGYTMNINLDRLIVSPSHISDASFMRQLVTACRVRFIDSIAKFIAFIFDENVKPLVALGTVSIQGMLYGSFAKKPDDQDEETPVDINQLAVEQELINSYESYVRGLSSKDPNYQKEKDRFNRIRQKFGKWLEIHFDRGPRMQASQEDNPLFSS